MSAHPLRIFSGSPHPDLAKEIASQLGVNLEQSTTQRLPEFTREAVFRES